MCAAYLPDQGYYRDGEDEVSDHPFDDIIKSVTEQIALGNLCYQKFTCAKCKNRLTIEEPNKFYTNGSCDKCGHITDIKAQGCNFMLIAPLRGGSSAR